MALTVMPLAAPSWASALTKPMLAGLCRGIIGLAHLAFLAIDGGDANHPAEIAVTHAAPIGLAHVEEGGEIGADDVIPLAGRSSCGTWRHG